MNKDIDKYKINDFLDSLTVKEYRFAMKIIPRILGVSTNTFHNYRRIKARDEKDIPYEKVKQLEILFGVGYGSLQNVAIEGKTLYELFKARSEDEMDLPEGDE